MAFTAQDVKKLREMSGAGMMDCKKALTETDGDMDKAIDYLREKSLMASAKKASRIAAEGIVSAYITDDAQQGVLIEVNCETDFVAKTDDFKNLVNNIARHIAVCHPATVEELMDQPYFEDNSKTIAVLVTEAVAKIGEKITIRRFADYKAENNGFINAYIHMNGSTGVLIEAKNFANTPENTATLHDIAMHSAAAKPKYVRREEVDPSELEKEKEILKAQALNEGKPANIVDRMVEGRVRKFYEEICLLEQPFVKEPEKTIGKFLEEADKGADIVRFELFIMGEGLEKRNEDFAAEVMGQMKK